MKIENIVSVNQGDKARVSATVIWEDCGRPVQEVFFETHKSFAEAISPNPHAFLVACLMPAMRYREERIFIDAEICPELRDGLNVALSWVRHWFDNYGKQGKRVRIESNTLQRSLSFSRPDRAGFFFSGGVDSIATLISNRSKYPVEHAGSIKDALLVYGLEVREPDKYEHVFRSASILANDAKVTLIPIYTNLRDLGPKQDKDFWQDFWLKEYMGAAFAAIAHIFTKRLDLVYIAASDDIPGLSFLKKQNFKPFSTHPLIDPNYSSTDLRIKHDGITLSRLERARLVVGWTLGLQHLRVCNNYMEYQPGVLNCGVCEKCVRTMLELLVCDALDKTTAFSENDVTEEKLNQIKIGKPVLKDSYTVEHNYLELIPYLMEKDRYDLVRGIEKLIARSRRTESKLKKEIKEFDRKYFNSFLSKSYRAVVSG